MIEFNAEQKACIDAIDGVWVAVSGPGSGKTTVLIERFMRMLIQGIPQKDILNLTFTHAAAEEMVRRAGLINADTIFRTFHSFAMELLKKEREHLSFKLCDTVIPVGMEDYKLLFDLIIRRLKTIEHLKKKFRNGSETILNQTRRLSNPGI